MRLRIEQRARLIFLYDTHRLEFAYKKYLKLTKLALKENITISEIGCRKIIEKWNLLESVFDLRNEDKGVAKTKISEHNLIRIDKAVYKDRDLTAPKLKDKFELEVSVRSVQRYVRVLVWRKVSSIIQYLLLYSDKKLSVIILDSLQNMSSSFVEKSNRKTGLC